MKYRKLPLLIFLIGSFFLQSCSSDEEKVESVPEVLTKSMKILSRTSGDLKTFLTASGLNLPIEEIQYDVTMYKVEYTTDYKSNSITASGLVFIPETKNIVSTLSFQHGTIAADRQAPSNLAINDSQLVFYSGLSALGFVVVIPDFIGFGASADLMHPYYVEDLTASSVIDNIYAAENLANELRITTDNELYLAGYSQGGYATMAAHKAIEEKGISRLNLVASFPASGGYDIIGVRDFFFENDTYEEPFFLAFVAQSFKSTYDWIQGLEVFFQEPYATKIPDLFDGSKNGSEINLELTTVVADLVTASFLSDPNASAYDFATQAFVENSLTDWMPAIPMHMYHGDADVTVPYQNSVDVYNGFIAAGVSENIVTFTPIPGGTHYTGVGPYIEHLVTELLILEQ